MKSTNVAVTNHTALLEMFPSPVVTLTRDLQACEFEELTKVWAEKKKKSFGSSLCHGDMVEEDTRHPLVFVESKIKSEVTSGG